MKTLLIIILSTIITITKCYCRLNKTTTLLQNNKEEVIPDSVINASDSTLTKYFFETYYITNITFKERYKRILTYISRIKKPDIQYFDETMLYALVHVYGDLNYREAKEQTIELIKKLISKGADVNAICGIQKMTPLILARDVDITKLLLENGANVNFHSKFGWTMLEFDMSLDRLKLAKQYNFDFSYIYNENRTLLHIAAYNNYCSSESLDFLINQIPQYINNFDDQGFAPIHIYCYHGFIDFYPLIDILIKHGANTKIKTQKDISGIPQGSTCEDIVKKYFGPITDKKYDNDKCEEILNKLKN